MKKDKPQLVPLSKQALAMFEELRGMASGSEWVLPSRGSLKEPIAHSTLNQAIRSLDLGILQRRERAVERGSSAFQRNPQMALQGAQSSLPRRGRGAITSCRVTPLTPAMPKSSVLS